MKINPNASDVPALYDAGELLVWDNIQLSHFKDLQKLNVHDVAKWKKLKSKVAFAPIRDTMKDHALSVWTHDTGVASLIQRMLRITENEIRNLVTETWFPDRSFGDEMHSWRFTLTKDEPLHYDVYADRVTTQVVRVFVNMDDEPRVWDVGPLSDDVPAAFDNKYQADVLKNVPVQRIEFPPGTVWAVDSKRVAHAIIYGKRAAMFSWEVK